MSILGDIFSSAEKIYDIADKARNAELLETIADFKIKIAQANAAIADLEYEKHLLLQQIRHLEQREADIKDLTLGKKGNAYFRNPIRKEEFNGPFCYLCQNPMIQSESQKRAWRCLACGVLIKLTEQELTLELTPKND